MSELIEKLNTLNEHLRTHIRGQNHVIERMCSVVTRAELGLHPPDQPKASVLFLGPTGVGKTELTKQIAKFIFGKELLYRFDMSEFLHLDQVKLFVGDESGQTGRLGTVLSKHNQGFLLIDEIEKAHTLIWDLFLQMIGDARITLADHKTYDPVSTSSALRTSGQSICNGRLVCLLCASKTPSSASSSRTFRPEFVGRFTDKIVFKPLSLDTQIEIAKLTVQEQLQLFRQKGFDNLDVHANAVEFLVRNGFHRTLGARPMKQVIAKFLGDAVAASVLANSHPSGTFDVKPDHSALILV